tara:strand:- start:136 stop:384 length:249 start_codon:yes stop_codon:yes gene_type:complete
MFGLDGAKALGRHWASAGVFYVARVRSPSMKPSLKFLRPVVSSQLRQPLKLQVGIFFALKLLTTPVRVAAGRSAVGLPLTLR